ncbi:unnamed protein product [Vitrella brassicaformis CCMP3155]|uniref:Uncharacterized protein n=1 Tax=Vitrella brassicaformis (strain CCMP3155) TaxID=1169540 RepID=A0A0G4GU88_VITBC|nr:unnamed protein product [Vitrella brassicaformis CCMP3155]|eukprot:CEM34310.1 unnamed protein product [Vitrella brassicaformis CCMP3155]
MGVWCVVEMQRSLYGQPGAAEGDSGGKGFGGNTPTQPDLLGFPSTHLSGPSMPPSPANRTGTILHGTSHNDHQEVAGGRTVREGYGGRGVVLVRPTGGGREMRGGREYDSPLPAGGNTDASSSYGRPQADGPPRTSSPSHDYQPPAKQSMRTNNNGGRGADHGELREQMSGRVSGARPPVPYSKSRGAHAEGRDLPLHGRTRVDGEGAPLGRGQMGRYGGHVIGGYGSTTPSEFQSPLPAGGNTDASSSYGRPQRLFEGFEWLRAGLQGSGPIFSSPYVLRHGRQSSRIGLPILTGSSTWLRAPEFQAALLGDTVEPTATSRDMSPLSQRIHRGMERLTRQIRRDGVVVGEGDRRATWLGQPTSVYGFGAMMEKVIRGGGISCVVMADVAERERRADR